MALLADFPRPNGPSSQEVAREWLTWLRDVRRRSALTTYQYAAKVESFLEWIKNAHLSEVSHLDMEAWLNRPRRGGGKGEPATVAKEVSLLKGLYGYALAREYVLSDPTALLGAPKVQNENPNPVPDDLWIKQWGCSHLSDEARAFLGLGYFCGLRRVEILSITPDAFDLRRNRIVKFRRKGGGDDVLDFGELTDLVSAELPFLIEGGVESFVNPLQEVVRCGRKVGRLFAWGEHAPHAKRLHALPLGTTDPQLIYRRLRRWQTQAGVPEGAYGPHGLRHAFVTNLLRCGVPIHLVSKLANHSNLSTTMRYAKVSGTDLRDWRRRDQALKASDFNRWESK